jgi:hypothetical protein
VKITQLILSIVGVGTAIALLLPAETNAFVLNGFDLPLTFRHFRVFNNFTDPEANDNTTPDPNFPGYTGATLAIWKGCTEWASRLHADNGNGDPHQPGGLGSGGANFDAVFQGLAPDAGGLGDNTFSELAGSSGGLLAFTEFSPFAGWRTRFYSTWTWDDDPGTTTTNLDIQGIACHQYGNALGLGNNNVAGSTMNSTILNSGVSIRSIEADDVLGLKAIYGAAFGGKPRITGISFSNGALNIQGANLDVVSNEVWFTPNTPTSSGTPVKLTGVPSDGSLITVIVPATAGSGEVFVKKAATAPLLISNGWPIDAASFPGRPGTAYCFGDGSLPTPCPCALPDTVPNPSGAPDAGCANSFSLNGAKLTAVGGTSPDTIVFTTVVGGNSAAFGFLLKGNASDPNGVANGDGVRCVDGQLIRFGGHNAGTNGAPLGTWTYPNSAQTIPVSNATLQPPGQAGYYQFFYRNNAAAFCNPATTNMSNGYGINWP